MPDWEIIEDVYVPEHIKTVVMTVQNPARLFKEIPELLQAVFRRTSPDLYEDTIKWDVSGDPRTPVIDKIFNEWVGEKYIKTLYEIIAYCLISDYPIHRLFCLIGAGLNGKGCFLRLLSKFIGEDNITSTELDVLLSSRFEVTRLHKKLVCMMGETN